MTQAAHEARRQRAIEQEEMMMARLNTTMIEHKQSLAALEGEINTNLVGKKERMRDQVDIEALKPKPNGH